MERHKYKSIQESSIDKCDSNREPCTNTLGSLITKSIMNELRLTELIRELVSVQRSCKHYS